MAPLDLRGQRILTLRGKLQQTSIGIGTQSLDAVDAGLGRQGLHQMSILRPDHRQLRARIAKEMLHFMRCIRDVDGYVDGAHAQTSDVEQHRLERLFDLDGYPVSRLDSAPHQGRRDSAGIRAQRPIGELAPLRRSKE
jgi:hypothetical protein